MSWKGDGELVPSGWINSILFMALIPLLQQCSTHDKPGNYSYIAMDTTKFASIRGRYFNGYDGTIRIFNEGDRLFMKYLRGEKPFEIFQISDERYISPDNYHSDWPMQFIKNPADGKQNLVFLESDAAIQYQHPLKEESDKVPYEYLLAGDFGQALQGYKSIRESFPDDASIKEDNLIKQGNTLINAGKSELAFGILSVASTLYPSSAKVFEAYGDATLKAGKNDLAITNFKKALALDPDNERAKRMLVELGAK
jgi:tetratricopeptide (TPR) repeat protein